MCSTTAFDLIGQCQTFLYCNLELYFISSKVFPLRLNTSTISTTCMSEIVNTSRLSFHVHTAADHFAAKNIPPFFSLRLTASLRFPLILFRRVSHTYCKWDRIIKKYPCILYIPYRDSLQVCKIKSVVWPNLGSLSLDLLL